MATRGQRPLNNSYLRVFQFRPLSSPALRRFKDVPDAPKERTIPPVDSDSVEFFLMLQRRGQKTHIK